MADNSLPRPFFEPLGAHHNRKGFDCGEPALNAYLQRYARQNADRNLGVTHVAVAAPMSADILGYYTLLTRSVERELFPRANTLAPDGVGVVLLGRLAVSQAAQNQRIGSTMLLRAMRQTAAASLDIGIHALIVDALNERVRNWYVGFGFQELADDKNHLFLSVRAIRELDLLED